MAVRALIGMQWGDEGKGKIVDILSENADVVVRCQGGANAGHTVVIDGTVFALHLVPSGMLRQGVRCVIGNGVVADPVRLAGEMRNLAGAFPDALARLAISDRAHIVMPWHKELDGLNEAQLGKGQIGTTKQGIGPAYTDKARRSGLRWTAARDAKSFEARMRAALDAANREITAKGGQPLGVTVLDPVREAVDYLRPAIADTVALLHDAARDGKNILIEGAQGAMLDIDFGTYPFVTSSNTTAGGCATGSGLAPNCITEVHGLLKAFTTRVGAGPFPSEADESAAVLLRGTGTNQWDEFGTTTGRPRRCGWLDLVAARFAARVNGVTSLHITKLDILSQFDTIKVCTAYEVDGRTLDTYPADLEELERCTPVYQTLPGWKQDIVPCADISGLPAKAREYVEFISRFLGVPVGTVSYGPGRNQTIRTGK